MKSDAKLNIFMLIPSFHPLPMGGAEKQAVLLAKELIETGKAEISVVTVGNNNLPSFEIADGIKIYRVFSLTKRKTGNNHRTATAPRLEGFDQEEKIYGKIPGFKELSYALFLFFKTFAIFYKKRKEYNIIHIHTVELVAFTASLLAILLNKKVLVKDSTMNGLLKVGLLPIFGKSIQKFIAVRCHFIAMTKKIEENLIRAGVKRNRIFLIPNGITIPEESYHKTRNDHVASFVGNLYQQPAKGVDILLRAWVKVIETHPQATLKIVGQGDPQAYEAFVDKLGIKTNVVFLGQTSDVKKLLLQTDVFILPSRREGMSNALMEAMALGVPCIATKISGSEDLIIHEESGLLINSEDHEALSDAIVFMFDNWLVAVEMGKHARKRVTELCSLKDIADKYYHAYNAIKNQ